MSADQPDSLASTAARASMAAAVMAADSGEDLGYVAELAIAVTERAQAIDHLRAQGIEPSPADVESWLALPDRQRRSVTFQWSVMQAMSVLRNPA
jgi:hypothetical protein